MNENGEGTGGGGEMVDDLVYTPHHESGNGDKNREGVGRRESPGTYAVI